MMLSKLYHIMYIFKHIEDSLAVQNCVDIASFVLYNDVFI